MSEGPLEGTNRARSTSGTVRRLLPFFAPYKGRLALVGVMLVIGTLAGLASPYLIGVAVDQFIIIPAGWRRRPGCRTGCRLAAAERPPGDGDAGVAGHLLVELGGGRGPVPAHGAGGQQVLLEMRSDILRQIQRLSLDFYSSHETGDLMSRLINDTQVINDMSAPG
jgi:ATP-binding cassette subfamily B protein